jgi:porphobilinogen synthase
MLTPVFRKTRQTDWIRRMVREHHLSVNDLILPLFLIDGENISVEIPSMPNVQKLSIDAAVKTAQLAASLGIPAIAIFATISSDKKDVNGSHILDPDNLINRATRAIKKAVPNIGLITDVALDPFTTHGHDGILRNGVILNDETVEILVKAAVIQADAGADIIAPSDMMDGRVAAIRDGLDKNGHENVAIMSYACKFASHFYGPYRDAVGTKGLLVGDKKTYYLDPCNSDEALREAQQDVLEGADMLLIKPGMPYLDVIYRVKHTLKIPTFGYQVSGEYASIMAAGLNGWVNGQDAMMESLLSFKRAGCDGIFTYFALSAARLLKVD